MRGEREPQRRNTNKACLDCSDLVVQFLLGRDRVTFWPTTARLEKRWKQNKEKEKEEKRKDENK